jgi:hypothetical protein
VRPKPHQTAQDGRPGQAPFRSLEYDPLVQRLADVLVRADRQDGIRLVVQLRKASVKKNL